MSIPSPRKQSKSPSPTEVYQQRFFLLIVLVLVFIAFSPSLKNHFVNWDDDVHLTENLSIRTLDGDNLKNIFTEKINKIYIPLTTVSFALEYRWAGLNPLVYHLDNILLHLGVVILVFIFSRGLGLSSLGAAAAALLFGIHPMRVESVAWVTERKDVLYALFYMASLNFYWMYTQKKKPGFYILAILSGTLSMLAKPMAVSLPLLLLLCDWFLRRKDLRQVIVEKIPFIFVCGGIAWLTYQEQIRTGNNTPFESFLILMWSATFYIKQFIFPDILLPNYPLPKPIHILNLEYGLALGIVLLLFGTAFWFRQHRWFIFSLLWYVFSIFFLWRTADVTLTHGPHNVADRFMYLPSVGFCFLWGFYLEKVWDWARSRASSVKKFLIASTFCLVMLTLAFRTFMQCQIWKNSLTLWTYQILFAPDPIAYNDLANAYRDLSQFAKIEAEYRKIRELSQKGVDSEVFKNKAGTINQIQAVADFYQKAIRLNPQYVDAYYNLAKYSQDLDKYKEAFTLYNKVLSLDPNHLDALFNLGKLFLAMGNSKEAQKVFDQILRSNPNDLDSYLSIINAYVPLIKRKPSGEYQKIIKDLVEQYRRLAVQEKNKTDFYLTLGNLYQDMGDFQNAKSAFDMALSLDPNDTRVLYNLGNLYEQIGQNQEAIRYFEKVIQLNPSQSQAHLNLGVIYSRLNNEVKAIESYEKAIQANPKEANAYFNLGFIFESKANAQKAIEYYAKATQTDPQHAEAFYNLGNVHAFLTHNEKAIAAYKKAIEIQPEHLNALVNLSILSFKEKDYAQALKYCEEAQILGYEAPVEYLRALERYREEK